MPDRPFLKHIKSLTWDDVFAIWRNNEKNIPRWIDHYRGRGFSSWDEWRRNTLNDFNISALSWKLFEIVSPREEIPQFLGGPFRAWVRKYYRGKKVTSFSEIVRVNGFERNAIINEMLSNFPAETYFVGLDVGAGIVILEGMHRGCALALAKQEGKAIKTRAFIALAEFSGEIPEMGKSDSPT